MYGFFSKTDGSFMGAIHEPASDTPSAVVIQADSFDDNCYLKDGAVKLKPPRPSVFHRFDYPTESWVLMLDDLKRDISNRRQQLLQASDWAALPDVPLTTEKRAEWATYRQALRDVTSQPGYPLNIVWPVAPT